jgi:hypothetical protein
VKCADKLTMALDALEALGRALHCSQRAYPCSKCGIPDLKLGLCGHGNAVRYIEEVLVAITGENALAQQPTNATPDE